MVIIGSRERNHQLCEIKIMSMTTVSNLDGDAGRTFAIEVTGSPHQARLRTSAFTVRVPYSSLAQTIHSIGQRGGKVVSVKMLTMSLTAVENMPVEEVAPRQAAKATENLPPESRRQQSKSKKR